MRTNVEEAIAEVLIEACQDHDFYSSRILNLDKLDQKDNLPITIHQKFTDAYTYKYYINLEGARHIWYVMHWLVGCGDAIDYMGKTGKNMNTVYNNRRTALLCS